VRKQSRTSYEQRKLRTAHARDAAIFQRNFAIFAAFLMISSLVGIELHEKGSPITDKSLFSVAIETRIWLYVGLCCDAGSYDGVTGPEVAILRSFPDTNELTLGEYFYEFDNHT
jgi:hypothetical protein